MGEFKIKNFGKMAIGNFPISEKDYREIQEENVIRILNLSNNNIKCRFAKVYDHPIIDFDT